MIKTIHTSPFICAMKIRLIVYKTNQSSSFISKAYFLQTLNLFLMGGKNSKAFDPDRLTEEERKKLEEGKPLQPIPGVKITKNPKTGKL